MHDGARRRMVGTVFLAVAAGCLWLALSFQGAARVLLIVLAALVAMPAVAGLFNPRVLRGVMAIAVTGALFAGAIAMAYSETTATQLIGFLLAYVTWFGFSACLFGTPLIALPFPPFILFPWRRLSEQQKSDMALRFAAIGLMVGMAAGVANLPRWPTGACRQTTGAQQSPPGDAPKAAPEQ